MANVNIDSSWLTANGPAPYRLSTPNTLYVLQQDVDVTISGFKGEVFLLTAPNVQLSKNGFYVTVNGADIPQNTDSSLYRRTSEATIRPEPTNPVHQYGPGTVFDGTRVRPMIDPNSGAYPPLVPYAQSN